MDDPIKKTVWFVEATSEDAKTSCGSAVAIRLKERATQETRSYLLTCGHVVRQQSSDNRHGFGKLVPTIRVLPPGWSESRFFRSDVEVAMCKHFSIKELEGDERKCVASDWVVLRMPDEFAHADSVPMSLGSIDRDLCIIGYPGERQSFEGGVATPVQLSDTFPVSSEENGVICLVGNQTRPGVSGGGVFDQEGRLVGIHRSRDDQALKLHAVSAKKIVEMLNGVGFDLVGVGDAPDDKPIKIDRDVIEREFKTEIEFLAEVFSKFPKFMTAICSDWGMPAESPSIAATELVVRVNDNYPPWLFKQLSPAAKKAGLDHDLINAVAARTVLLAFSPEYLSNARDAARGNRHIEIPADAGKAIQHIIKKISNREGIEGRESFGGSEIDGVWESGPVAAQSVNDVRAALFQLYGIDPASPTAEEKLEGELAGAKNTNEARFVVLDRKDEGLAKLLASDPCLAALLVLVRAEGCKLHPAHKETAYPTELERIIKKWFNLEQK